METAAQIQRLKNPHQNRSRQHHPLEPAWRTIPQLPHTRLAQRPNHNSNPTTAPRPKQLPPPRRRTARPKTRSHQGYHRHLGHPSTRQPAPTGHQLPKQIQQTPGHRRALVPQRLRLRQETIRQHLRCRLLRFTRPRDALGNGARGQRTLHQRIGDQTTARGYCH